MTNEQAIKAVVDVALQWADIPSVSQFGSGYRSAMIDVASALADCPAGRAAMLEARKGGKKALRTAKAGQIGGKGRKTRAKGGCAV